MQRSGYLHGFESGYIHRSPRRADLEQACSVIAATCACSTVRLASRAITNFYDAVLTPTGLRSTQFVVLIGVFRGFGTTITELGKVLGLDRSSLSRNLRPLLRRGLVSRAPTRDRRRRALQITRNGERLLARTIPYWHKAQQEVATAIGSDKWETLGSALRGLASEIRVRMRR